MKERDVKWMMFSIFLLLYIVSFSFGILSKYEYALTNMVTNKTRENEAPVRLIVWGEHNDY
jgi:hypothetical protein